MKRIISKLLLSFMTVSLVMFIELINKTNDNLIKTESLIQEDLIEENIIIVHETMQETETKNYFNFAVEEMDKKMTEIKFIEDRQEWFLAYKELINEYSEWCDSPETIYDYYTSNEIFLMQRVIETETYEADFDSKCNVASVIFNRINIEDHRFGNTPYEIITSPNQFSYFRTNISEDTVLALEYSFQIGDTTNGALYFHSGQYSNMFNDAYYIFTDKAGHHFYK